MARSIVTEDRARKEASYIMLHVGLDLSRKRLDVCLISDQGELVDELAAPFDEDGLRRLSELVAARRMGRVRAVVETMSRRPGQRHDHACFALAMRKSSVPMSRAPTRAVR